MAARAAVAVARRVARTRGTTIGMDGREAGARLRPLQAQTRSSNHHTSQAQSWLSTPVILRAGSTPQSFNSATWLRKPCTAEQRAAAKPTSCAMCAACWRCGSPQQRTLQTWGETQLQLLLHRHPQLPPQCCCQCLHATELARKSVTHHYTQRAAAAQVCPSLALVSHVHLSQLVRHKRVDRTPSPPLYSCPLCPEL